MIKDPAEPEAESAVLSIGINSIITLEATRQSIKILVTLHIDPQTTELALIDSGAGGNFIDEKTVKDLQLQRTELRTTIKVKNVDRSQNNNGLITHRTKIETTIAGKQQTLSLLITGLGNQRLILGLPWLKKEDPIICWKARTLEWKTTNRSPSDNDEYLKETREFLINTIEMYEDLDDWDLLPEIEIAKAKISEQFNERYGNKKEKKNVQNMIPKEYHKYLKVFNEEAAARVPKPTPFDHEIILKEDAKTFKQSPYVLNPKQMELAREFVETNLKKGYIVPSKSPMASPLFLCRKERHLENETLSGLQETQ